MRFAPVTDPGRVPALVDLWMEAFGEEKEAVLPFFREIFPLCRAWQAEEDGALCAMAYALPQPVTDGKCRLPAAYLYAVATKKEYRGKGIASRLLQEMEQSLRDEGFAGLLLVPANPGLFSFYEKLGLVPFSFRGWVTVTAGAGEAETCTPEEYLALREEFLQNTPHNVPPAAVLNHLELFRWQGGCGAAERTEGGTVFRELLGDPIGASAALTAMGAETARAMLPAGDVPYAVAKALRLDFPKTGYFAFAME